MIKDSDFHKFIIKQVEDLGDKGMNDDKSLTNILLLVSTGSFGLSITFFLSNSLPALHCIYLLKISWIFLASSIFTNALGYFLARESAMSQMNFLNKRLVSKDDFTTEEYNKKFELSEKGFLESGIVICNILCFITFFIGLVSLVSFAILQV